MLILHRKIGESVLIEDAVVTVIEIDELGFETKISLAKHTGEAPIEVAVPLQEKVEICHEVQVVFIEYSHGRARLGFEAPETVVVMRI